MDTERVANIRRLLNKVLEPSFDLSEIQLNVILEHLPQVCPDHTEEDFFIPWLRRAINVSSEKKLSINSILLICSTTGLMCRKEEIFLNLSFNGIFDTFFKNVLGLSEIRRLPCVQYHYIKLITNIFQHKSGIQWISATNFWYDIYSLTVARTDEKVFAEGCKFLVELIDISKHDNQVFYIKVLKILLAPLLNLGKIINYTDVTMETETIDEDVIKRLHILDTVFYGMFIKSCKDKNYKFINLLQKQFKIEQVFEDLAKNIKVKEVNFLLNKLWSLVVYYTATSELKDTTNVCTDKVAKLNLYSAKICDIILNLAQLSVGYTDVLDLIHLNHIYFKTAVKDSPWESFITKEFQYQMSILIGMPICHIFEVNKIWDGTEEDGDEIRERLVSKMLRQYTPLVLHTCCRVKKDYSIEDAVAALIHIQHYAKSYEFCVVTQFAQMLIYYLIDAVNYFAKTEVVSPDLQELLVAIVETLIYLLTEFDLSWKDSVETVYVSDIVVDFLDLPNLSQKLVTRLLQLQNVAVRRDLSPEMILLSDDIDILTERSDQYAEMFKRKLKDTSWEIRNACVQIFHAASQTKQDYRSIKSLMKKFGYPEEIWSIATNDPEITVRISALRCFTDMTRTGMSNYLMEGTEFYETILNTLKTEPMGNVRSEYVALISILYEYLDLPQDIVNKFYGQITSAVLQDDNLSVKTNALSFWLKVIDSHLKDEGMIDGDFPTMTFSKELKKIITFNRSLVKKCLRRILYRLSEIGCLTSFLFALHFDQDPYLVQTALKLIKPFIDLLKKYYWEPIVEKEFILNSITASSPRRSSNIDTHLDSNFDTNSSDSNSNSDAIMNSNFPTNDEGYLSPSSNCSNVFSPYPETLYEDILDMQDTIMPEPDFPALLMEDPAMIQLNEFLLYTENLDFSTCNGLQPPCSNENDIDVLLNSILN